jgi:hypothetical protein
MSAEGRACLLENHRDNFIADPQTCRRSLNELDELMRQATARHADLRFLSTREFGAVLLERDPRWLLTRWRTRLPFVWRRLAGTGRPWKLLVLTGAAALGSVLVTLLGQRELPEAHRSTA